MTVSNQAERVIGVDVAKNRLDIADSQGKIRKTISNTAPAIKKAIVQKVKDGDSVFVVCEATGGYERGLVKTLQDAGISVAIANPRQVRQFASAMGRLEKSDPIDAEAICQFAQTAELPAAPVKTAEQEARDAVVRRREQVLEMIGQENNRLQQESDPKMKKTIERVLKTLKSLLKKLDAEVCAFPCGGGENERQRRGTDERSGSRGGDDSDAAVRAAGIGTAQPQRDRKARWSCTDRP